MFIRAAKKTVSRLGHNFELKYYYQLTRCKFSDEVIWGIGPQGYHCSCKCVYHINVPAVLLNLSFRRKKDVRDREHGSSSALMPEWLLMS